ncbi:hypothetical protein [uncultured Parasutterella sp.]|uniref:hypothetical protein n=1 Tax=uncultured Parasutterella sp. TaxID=1263098 RepID=UPI0025917D01|nr:hypothetical protein [uncultured Parasutterella sp.]
MLHIPALITRRLNLELKELTISQAVSLASMPLDTGEQETTKFIGFIVDKSNGLSDPRLMTVQERMLIVAQYLCAASDDGPDFSIGENAHYSDYLDGAADVPETDKPVYVADVEGDKWCVQPLLGYMAEAIERLQGELKDNTGAAVSPYVHWLIGTLSAQLVRENEEIPQEQGKYEEFLIHRMRVFFNYPESAFAQLLFVWNEGKKILHHFFNLEIDEVNGGYVVLPKEGAENSEELPLVKFPVHTCLSPIAGRMGKNFAR